ncbi:MAG: hypothetical protein PHN56_05755 [Candidatus Nanoarchaeia archaeon]|nr:hypothetical protein [Candidatus Nanoarchaeia archaeon]
MNNQIGQLEKFLENSAIKAGNNYCIECETCRYLSFLLVNKDLKVIYSDDEIKACEESMDLIGKKKEQPVYSGLESEVMKEINNLFGERIKAVYSNFYEEKDKIFAYTEKIQRLFSDLKINEAELNGEKYFYVSHNFSSTLKEDAQEFYGTAQGIEKLAAGSDRKSFEYGCMISQKTMKYEIIFNHLFAKYDYKLKEIAITPLNELIERRLKLEKMAREFSEIISKTKMPRNAPINR